MKITFKTVELTDDTAVSFLEQEMANRSPSVMIDEASRQGRRHLRLRKDGRGYFVCVGSRGHDKRYLGRCKIVYFDGEATLHKFTFADQDAFEADQERRWGQR